MLRYCAPFSMLKAFPDIASSNIRNHRVRYLQMRFSWSNIEKQPELVKGTYTLFPSIRRSSPNRNWNQSHFHSLMHVRHAPHKRNVTNYRNLNRTGQKLKALTFDIFALCSQAAEISALDRMWAREREKADEEAQKRKAKKVISFLDSSACINIVCCGQMSLSCITGSKWYQNRGINMTGRRKKNLCRTKEQFCRNEYVSALRAQNITSRRTKPISLRDI